MDALEIRSVTPADAAAIAAIYKPIVEQTHITFETVAPSPGEMAERIRSTTQALPWLVAVGTEVVGYAYASPHSSRQAYDWSVDTSIYLSAGAAGRGIGTRLYAELIQVLTGLGLVSAYAGIALPNEPSVALHRRMGFVHTGSLPVAGYKLGRWHDVSLWRRELAPPRLQPNPPTRWDGAGQRVTGWPGSATPAR